MLVWRAATSGTPELNLSAEPLAGPARMSPSWPTRSSPSTCLPLKRLRCLLVIAVVGAVVLSRRPGSEHGEVVTNQDDEDDEADAQEELVAK